MNYVWYSFRLSLRKTLRSRGLLTLALLALGAMVLLLLPGKETGAPVRVGLALPQSCGALEEKLLARNSPLVEFIPTDMQTMERNILTGRWDCGLTAGENLMEAIGQGQTRNLVTLVTGPGSTVFPIVRETAAACLMELMAPYLAGQYLDSLGVDPGRLEPVMDRLRLGTEQVAVHMKTLSGGELEPFQMARRAALRMARGIGGLMMLIWSLYQAVDLGRWLFSGRAARLACVQPVTSVLLPRLAGSFLPMLALALLCLPALDGGWYTGAALGAFGLVMTGLALVVSRFPALWQGIPAVLPFLAMACLIFEPVLLDVAVLFPKLSALLCWLPLGLFLRGGDGEPWAILALAAEGAALLALSRTLDRGRKPGGKFRLEKEKPSILQKNHIQ